MNWEMTTLKALMKVRLATFKKMYMGKRTGKDGKQKNTTLVSILVFGYVAVMLLIFAFSSFFQMSGPLYDQELDWLYFAMYALFDFCMMFLGSVFTAKAQLYDASDNDMLLSMPIKTRDILISRLFSLWIINEFFNISFSVAAAVAWILCCPVTVKGAFGFVLISMLLPFFSIALSAFFGFFISLVTRRVNNKTMLTVISSIAFLAVYFVLVGKLQSVLHAITENGIVFADKFNSVFILRWIGIGIADGSVLYLLLSAAVLILPFVVAFVVLDRTFISSATSSHGAARKKHIANAGKTGSVFGAFYKKEFRRFTSSAVYMLNAGLGVLIEPVTAVIISLKMPMLKGILSAYGFGEEYIHVIVIGVLLALGAMADISAPSISIEGSTLWIAQVVPVPSALVLKSKLAFHFTLSGAAAFIASVIIAAALCPGILVSLAIVVIPLLFSVFTGIFGLLANLKYPVLDWENESQAVKSGIGIFIATFGSIGAALLFTAVTLVLSVFASKLIALFFTGTLIACIDIVLYKRLITKGAEKFSEL